MKFGGVITAAITPVSKDGQIDIARLAHHSKILLSEGCSHISTFGTTGEGASFSAGQKIAAIELLAKSGQDMSLHIPAIISSNVEDAGKLLAAYDKMGCAAALVLPPFFYTDLSDTGVVSFFEAMSGFAGNPDIPMLLYNIPRYSSVHFTPLLVEKLVDRFGSRIAGIKDSTGDLENGLMLVKHFPDLAVFTGDDRVMSPLVAAGGAGLIGGMPNVFAADLVDLYTRPDHASAEKLKAKAATRIEVVDSNGGLSVLKSAVAHKYCDDGWLRMMPPLEPIAIPAARNLLATLDVTTLTTA